MTSINYKRPKPEGESMAPDLQAIAGEIFAALTARRPIAPFTNRPENLTLDEAYRVSALLHATRETRGERRIGRKIGFTNRTIWSEYNVHAPIWGYVYDTTVHTLSDTATCAAGSFAAPRIEPEIVLGLARAPTPDMDEASLLGCIDWLAHGFEIVQSVFPDWRFLAPDTVAMNGLHGALFIGPRHAVGDRAAEWLSSLASFAIDLYCDGRVVDRGRAENVLGGPLLALAHLVGLLARDPVHPPLAAGEIVTTGTLTRAMPVGPGDTWQTAIRGAALDGIRLGFV